MFIKTINYDWINGNAIKCFYTEKSSDLSFERERFNLNGISFDNEEFCFLLTASMTEVQMFMNELNELN